MFSCWISLAQRSRTSGVSTLEFVLLMARGLISLLSIAVECLLFSVIFVFFGEDISTAEVSVTAAATSPYHYVFPGSDGFYPRLDILTSTACLEIDQFSFLFVKKRPLLGCLNLVFTCDLWCHLAYGIIFSPLNCLFKVAEIGVAECLLWAKLEKYTRDNATICQGSNLCPYPTSAI